MILVTGGAGYIGSHCILALLEKGCEVCCFDNLSTGHKEIVDKLASINQEKFSFIKGDLLDYENINNVFVKNNIDAVIHFAAYSQVQESVANPAKYYTNNIIGTLNLLNAMNMNNVNKIVFSSTAAIYGEPEYTPIDENHSLNPINSYGYTKLIIEKILDDYDKAYKIKSVRLRYFNVIGADSNTRIGEWHEPETHLIPNILKSAFNKSSIFKIYGNDYQTKDGTCIRDYIDVEDLAQAHIHSLDYLINGGNSDFFNLGTNEGNSVKEVYEKCKEITGIDIAVKIESRREGDPKILVANNQKAKNILGWYPKKTLADSIETAYKWEKSLI